MTKRSKTKAGKKKARKRMNAVEKRLSKQIQAIHDRLIPPAVQAIVSPGRSKAAPEVLSASCRLALRDTITLLARVQCIETVSRECILHTVPPIPLRVAQSALEAAQSSLRAKAGSIQEDPDVGEVELLLYILQEFERVTRPPDLPRPTGSDDYPGPLANQQARVA